MSSLTSQQARLLAFIRAHIAEQGFSPSFDEMTQAMGLRSKSGIHRLISGLEERGFIRRIPNRARCIELVEAPTLGNVPPPRIRQVPTSDLLQELWRRGFRLQAVHA